MKRLISFLLCVFLLAGCGGSGPDTDREGYTFTDDLGRTVTVSEYSRTAVLLGSFAQVWQLAGGQVCATAEDAWDDLQLPLSEDTVNLGGMQELSMELLLSSRPDFIIASANTRQNLEWRETLEATGIPTAYFNVSDFDSYLRMLKICTDITGRPELYTQNGTSVQDRIDRVRDAAAQRGTAPTVLCMRASGSLITVKNSEDNVLGEILRDLGCRNIADSDSSLLENLSIERILEADPEYIFIAQRGDDREKMMANVQTMMRENPAWLQLTAVKEGRVYYMDKNLYTLKPNHRWGEAYEQLEEILEHG